MARLTVRLNPLLCPEIELAGRGSPPPAAETLLKYLVGDESQQPAVEFVARYREIAGVGEAIPAAPNEPTILERLVFPLRRARGSYAIGDYIGCIASCGMVGEMVAMLLWDISKAQIQGKRMFEQDERGLFGYTFERLGQERRVEVLKSFNLADAVAGAAFDGLRKIRRRYLHFLSQGHASAGADARDAYRHATQLVLFVLGQSFEEGKMVLRPDLMTFLEEKGLLHD